MIWRNTLRQVMMQQPVITLGVESRDERKHVLIVIFKLFSIKAVCQLILIKGYRIDDKISMVNNKL